MVVGILRENYCLPLGSIASIICFAITGVFDSWYRAKFFYS